MKLQAIRKSEIDIPNGFSGTILKGHTVIDVIEDKLPPDFDYLRLNIVSEDGQGYTNTGYATILTTPQGKPLSGFKIVTAGNGKGRYGYVNVSKDFVSIEINRSGDIVDILISQHSIIKKKPFHVQEWLWSYSGDISEASIPERYFKFQKALDSAIDKSKCYHCHCLHFYERNKPCQI